MSQPQWSELEQIVGHVFTRRQRLEQALTHSSLAYERSTGRADLPSSSSQTPDARQPRPLQDNEQLEFLGDAVLGLIVAESLFRSYPELSEGDLTRLRAQLVSRRHLGHVGARLLLGTFMRLGRGEERSGGRNKAVLLANAVEAVIAALYLDGGMKAATAFVSAEIVAPYLDGLHAELEAGQAMGDHKSALQEWLQSHHLLSAQYRVKAESGPDHRKRFLIEVCVYLHPDETEDGSPMVAEGVGSTKKKAEQEAARLLYASLTETRGAGRSDLAEKVAG